MKKLVLVAMLQVPTILGWAAYHEYVWATAPTFRIPLRPRDPYDVLRGRYFVLNPSDAVIETGSSPLTAEEVARFLGSSGSFYGYAAVGFCPIDQLYRVCALRRLDEQPSGAADFWSRAYVTVVSGKQGPSVRVDLGLSRFFIPSQLRLPAPEATPGWELEVSHRPGLAPLPKRLFFQGKAVDLR